MIEKIDVGQMRAIIIRGSGLSVLVLARKLNEIIDQLNEKNPPDRPLNNERK